MMLSQDLTGLATPPPAYDFQPQAAGADPTNHLAIGGIEEPDYCNFKPAQLASYTVASDGSIVSTNTTTNMPTPHVNPTVMNMSPSSQFLAVGGNTTFSPETPGLQVFHFNGASPITSYSGVLTSTPIDEIHWDSNNHLYALSNSTPKLYIYTVHIQQHYRRPRVVVHHSGHTEGAGGCADFSHVQRPGHGWSSHLLSRERFNRQFAGFGAGRFNRDRDYRSYGVVARWRQEIYSYLQQATQYHRQLGRRNSPLRCPGHQHRGAEVAERCLGNCKVGQHQHRQKPALPSGLFCVLNRRLEIDLPVPFFNVSAMAPAMSNNFLRTTSKSSPGIP